MEPRRRPLVLWDADKGRRKESPGCVKEKVEPRLSFVQSPHFQLVRELPELAGCQKIFEFRRGCWHATGDFVAADAGEHDAIALRHDARFDLAAGFVGANA